MIQLLSFWSYQTIRSFFAALAFLGKMLYIYLES